jgi:hypothetical protein
LPPPCWLAAAAGIHSLDCMHMNKCLCACDVGTLLHDYNGRGEKALNGDRCLET